MPIRIFTNQQLTIFGPIFRSLISTTGGKYFYLCRTANFSNLNQNMLRPAITFTSIIFLTGCSALKQTGLNPNQGQTTISKTTKTSSENIPAKNNEPRFLDHSEVRPDKSVVKTESGGKGAAGEEIIKEKQETIILPTPAVETATSLQMKYALLLDTEVEEAKSLRVYSYLEQWLGTRYCMGGTTKNCIDCSAFTQMFFSSIYGITIPRTAREQFKATTRISRTELREGDLLFYNTRGGVSHVGVYLQNNKFAHASSSDGVTISDMFDPYWMKRFIGVGRIKNVEKDFTSAR